MPTARSAPLLFGQANSNFNDSDAGMESLDFGGLIGDAGPSRIPQIRWTQPLGGWGLLGALSVVGGGPRDRLCGRREPAAFGRDSTRANSNTDPGDAAGSALPCRPASARPPSIR